MRRFFRTISVVMFLPLLGCSSIVESAKVFWGSSTKALEEARIDSMKATFECDYFACFDSVINMAEEQTKETFNDETEEVTEETVGGKLIVFLKNRQKRQIVVMGIPGNIQTTEVGVFFTPLEENVTRIEISSLSSSAKRNASRLIFEELKGQYREVSK